MTKEIKIAHIHLDSPLTLTEECVQLLVVENPDEFYATVAMLDKQLDGEEGEYVFSRNGETINPNKFGAMVCDLFHFDLNDKKILNLLHKKLEATAFGELLPKFHELSAQTVRFMEELAYGVPFSLDYEEPQPIDYLKATGIRFSKSYQSLEEKLICYINALIELKRCEFFVFVNLKSVLSDKKLLQLYEHCRKEQVGLLLVENKKQRALLPCEKAVIITEDLCEILENYHNLC